MLSYVLKTSELTKREAKVTSSGIHLYLLIEMTFSETIWHVLGTFVLIVIGCTTMHVWILPGNAIVRDRVPK